MLLHSKREDEMLTQGLQQAIEMCKPGDVTFFVNGHSFGLYDSSSCLLIISALSQKCENKSLSQQAADDAISCALAEPYDTLEGLLGVLKDLTISFQRLEFPILVKKVEYYKSEIESPTLSQTPSVFPKLFDIYWVSLGKTKGAEIKKQRPCIIVTKPTHYGKGDMVTVIPLSTKRKQIISSIPFLINNESQEARLDQVRSVDISRLENYFGSLSVHYRVQLRIAHKNYQAD
jgi:mRNA interferase MazF